MPLNADTEAGGGAKAKGTSSGHKSGKDGPQTNPDMMKSVTNNKFAGKKRPS